LGGVLGVHGFQVFKSRTRDRPVSDTIHLRHPGICLSKCPGRESVLRRWVPDACGVRHFGFILNFTRFEIISEWLIITAMET